MASSSVNAIIYYDGAIITTLNLSMFVSGSPKIVQLDNKMSFDALKKAIGNMISLPKGKVVKDIHFLLPILFFGDCS